MSHVYYPLGQPEGMSEGEYQAMYADPDDPDDCGPPRSLGERSGYWRKRDGPVIEVSAMTTRHLLSAVALFDRAGWGDHPKIRELREEIARRGR